MNTESIERLSVFVWVAIATWLGFLALSTRGQRSKLLRAILWLTFVIFTFTWIPVFSFGILAIPSTFVFVECLVALPFDDGSEKFHGVPRLSPSVLFFGMAVLVAVSVAGIVSLMKGTKKNEEAS